MLCDNNSYFVIKNLDTGEYFSEFTMLGIKYEKNVINALKFLDTQVLKEVLNFLQNFDNSSLFTYKKIVLKEFNYKCH